MKLTESQYIA